MDNNQDQETLKAPKGQEDEEEEEALSLRDFPLNSDEPTVKEYSSRGHDQRTSSSQPSDSFEFSNDLNSQNMSHAEDIISCGKLVPYNKKQPLFDDQILKSLSRDDDAIDFSRRYCDSLPELSPTTTRLTRSSRSLDSKKLRRNSSLVMKSEASEIRRSFSKESVKSEGFYKGLKPRWCVLMFGPVKLPPEMDLRDMKNRQARRSSGSMFPAVEGGGRVPGDRSDRRSSWGYDWLRVLSCKNHASVDAIASIGIVPEV
ncbi:hypothetical protein CDL12_25719 [Handroanthus impetiginosus]|uniref:Uncharacterized protein n=1 Tax=Handroanthus impetiginosus TaxID=429701 RepID=A0A2G9G9X2_9LAMI|nr:hypothetical protein CDL12_25719 [Handroanthus impetiginosus]